MTGETKHTEIGDIPGDWEIQTFEETFRILSNNTLPRADLNYRGGSVRNVHYGDILTRYGEVLDCGKEEIPYISHMPPAPVQLLQDGDVLLADTAEDETAGKAVEVYGLGEDRMAAGLHTIPCRVRKGNFAPKWLGYFMNSHVYHDQILPFITGIKVSSISKAALSGTILPIPPRAEQERMVSALSDMDAAISALKRLIRKKGLVKYGAMNDYLTGDKRLQGFSGEWEQTTLGRIADIKDGTHQTPRYVENGIPFYSVETVTTGDFRHVKRISREEHRQLTLSYKIEKGDVLMTRIGSLGKCRYIDWDVEASFYVSLALLKFRGDRGLARFVAFLSELGSFAREVELHSLQFAIPMKINLGEIADVRLRIPVDAGERDALTEMFGDMEAEIVGLKAQLAKMEELKQGMMSGLFTGKIRLA